MIAVLNCDIVRSRAYEKKDVWLKKLKQTCHEVLEIAENDAAIYRGDSLQIRIYEPLHALKTALILRLSIRADQDMLKHKLDLRIAIGLGDETYAGESVSEADGDAYYRAAEVLEQIDESGRRLNIKTPLHTIDHELQVTLYLLDLLIGGYPQATAEAALLALSQAQTQEALSKELGITQGAVSQRLAKAHMDAVQATLRRYRHIIHSHPEL